MKTATILSVAEAERLHAEGGITDATLARVREVFAMPPVVAETRSITLHKRTPCERRRYLRRHVPDGADPVEWVRMMLAVKKLEPT